MKSLSVGLCPHRHWGSDSRQASVCRKGHSRAPGPWSCEVSARPEGLSRQQYALSHHPTDESDGDHGGMGCDVAHLESSGSSGAVVDQAGHIGYYVVKMRLTQGAQRIGGVLICHLASSSR